MPQAPRPYDPALDEDLVGRILPASVLGTTHPFDPKVTIPFGGSGDPLLGVIPNIAERPQLTKNQLDTIVSEYGGNSQQQSFARATNGVESNYGQNSRAYAPNRFGVIGTGQITSQQLGGKYPNFENYATTGHDDPYNPVDSAIAATRMQADIAKKTGYDPLAYSKQYFGPGVDITSGQNAGNYSAKLVNRLSGAVNNDFVNTPIQSVATKGAVSPLTTTVPELTDGLGVQQQALPSHATQFANLNQAASYEAQAVAAARTLAAANLASTNAQGTNDANHSGASYHLGQSASTDANLQAAALAGQRKMLSDYNPDGSQKSFGRKLFDYTLGASMYTNNIKDAETRTQTASDELKRLQTNTTGQQAINTANEVSPTVLDAAARGLVPTSAGRDAINNSDTLRGQSNNSAALGVGGLNIQQQQVDVTKQKELDAAAKVGAGKDGYIDQDPNWIKAADTLGVVLPPHVKISEWLNRNPGALGDSMQQIASNGGVLSRDINSAVEASQQYGLPVAVQKQGAQLGIFRAAALKQAGLAPVIGVDATGTPRNPKDPTYQAELAAYSAKANTILSDAAAGAAAGDPKYSGLAGNPYASATTRETLASGVQLPTGITKADLLGADYSLFKKMKDNNISYDQMAATFKALSAPSSNDFKYSVFNLPNPTGAGKGGNIIVTIPNVPKPFDFTNPQDLSRYYSYLKANEVGRYSNLDAQGNVLPDTAMTSLLHGSALGKLFNTTQADAQRLRAQALDPAAAAANKYKAFPALGEPNYQVPTVK